MSAKFPIKDLEVFFDWKFYLGKYSDRQKAGLKTESQALQHYRRYGIQKGQPKRVDRVSSNDEY